MIIHRPPQPSVFTQTGPAVFNGEGLPANPGMYNVSSSSA